MDLNSEKETATPLVSVASLLDPTMVRRGGEDPLVNISFARERFFHPSRQR